MTQNVILLLGFLPCASSFVTYTVNTCVQKVKMKCTFFTNNEYSKNIKNYEIFT